MKQRSLSCPLACLCLVTLLLIIPRNSHAWSSVGHQTIAYIAETRLTPATRIQIQAILAPGETLPTAATWADAIRKHRPATKTWHYVNLPVRDDVSTTNLARYCKPNDLLTQIQTEVATLQMPQSTNKLEALRFLIHFIGDSTMPLHCSDDHDRGGNEKIVIFSHPSVLGIRGIRIDLHALWDNIIQKEAKEDPRKLARKLDRQTPQAAITAWAQGTPADWVLDTYTVAKKTVYADLPPGPTPKGQDWSLPRRYYSQMRPVAEEQIEKAGIRLAHLLNAIFDSGTRTSADGTVTVSEERIGKGFHSPQD